MKLCLDNIIFSLQQAGGISLYWSELWSLLLRDQASVMAIESDYAGANIFRSKIQIPPSQIQADTRPVPVGRYLNSPVKFGKVDLLHSSYYRRPASSRVPHIQSCYDFTYERYRKGSARWLHSWQKRQALTSAQGVICISESTRSDLLHYCPSVKDDKTCVIHLGFSDAFQQLSKESAACLVSPYIHPNMPFSVFVGDRSAYKNFTVAVDAVAQCADHRLVVVGGGELRLMDSEYLERRLSGRWVHIDKAPSPLLNALYNCACALIYPSAYEGFGIPVIEAMAAGCPVIAVNGSSIPEAAGDAGILLDIADGDAVAHQLQLLEHDDFRSAVIACGLQNVKRFSWERCYQETLTFYARILG